MSNIALIGAGDLGSRHLQALALCSERLAIYVVDPNKAALEMSKGRFEEVDNLKNKKLYFKDSMDGLPPNMDFAVIATTSLHRMNALKELLNVTKVRYLVLEKFLFPTLEEYFEAEQLLVNHNVKTYVNCARRLFPLYHEIKSAMSNDKNIRLSVVGVRWNLASNSIHFLDLFSYLTGSNKFTIITSGLDYELLENKRKGYVEFSGNLSVVDEYGNKMQLISLSSGDIPTEVSIHSNNHDYKINEVTKEVTYLISGDEIKCKFELLRQSELTNIIYKQLMETDHCDLVEYKESAEGHIILLKAFNKFLGERTGVIT